MGRFRRGICVVVRPLYWVYRFVSVLFLVTVVVVLCLATLVSVVNMVSGVPLDVAFRALDPASEACHAPPEGWEILAKYGNDERRAIEFEKDDWEMRLHCSIQTHAIPEYQPVDATGRRRVRSAR